MLLPADTHTHTYTGMHITYTPTHSHTPHTKHDGPNGVATLAAAVYRLLDFQTLRKGGSVFR